MRAMFDPLFAAVESSALSRWMREAPTLWAFPFILILHTWGLAFVVGANVAIDVRVLGLARAVPALALGRYFTIMWVGFWVNAVSGVALLIAYPTKALTNPLFYLKLALIAVALVTAHSIQRQMRMTPVGGAVAQWRLKVAAAVSLMCWTASIPAGRLLAYTYTRLTVGS